MFQISSSRSQHPPRDQREVPRSSRTHRIARELHVPAGDKTMHPVLTAAAVSTTSSVCKYLFIISNLGSNPAHSDRRYMASLDDGGYRRIVLDNVACPFTRTKCYSPPPRESSCTARLSSCRSEPHSSLRSSHWPSNLLTYCAHSIMGEVDPEVVSPARLPSATYKHPL
jgi:hypothetical protein